MLYYCTYYPVSYFRQAKEVAGIIENVYSKFKLMLIKRDDGSKNSLVAQLTRINDHLVTAGFRFLTGNS